MNYNLHERKDGLSDYDFVKIELNGILLKTSVSVKILTGWVVAITLPESLQASSEADKLKFFEVCHDFLGKRYGFDNIVGRNVHMDETTSHMHKNSVIHDERKQHRVILPRHKFNRTDLKSFHKDLSVGLERVSSVLTWACMKTRRR